MTKDKILSINQKEYMREKLDIPRMGSETELDFRDGIWFVTWFTDKHGMKRGFAHCRVSEKEYAEFRKIR